MSLLSKSKYLGVVKHPSTYRFIFDIYVINSLLNNNLGGNRFGYTEDGKPGYITTDEDGADTVVPFSGSIYIETVHTTSTSQTGAQVKVLQMKKISNDFKTKSSNLKYNSIGNSGTFSLFKVTYSDLKWHITMLKKVQCSNGKYIVSVTAFLGDLMLSILIYL